MKWEKEGVEEGRGEKQEGKDIEGGEGGIRKQRRGGEKRRGEE